MTTWYSQDSKKYAGYNFAFVANTRDASAAARQKKYGKDAVIFQAAGVQAYHYGDNEDQIMFWGPSINKDKLVLLKHDDDWMVVPNRPLRSNREFLKKGDFKEVVHWVMQNYRQYSKVL